MCFHCPHFISDTEQGVRQNVPRRIRLLVQQAVPALESWKPPNTSVRPYNRGSGSGAPAGSRGRVSGQGAKPPEAEALLAFERSLKVANLPTCNKKLKRKKSATICVVFLLNDVYRLQYVTDYCTVYSNEK